MGLVSQRFHTLSCDSTLWAVLCGRLLALGEADPKLLSSICVELKRAHPWCSSIKGVYQAISPVRANHSIVSQWVSSSELVLRGAGSLILKIHLCSGVWAFEMRVLSRCWGMAIGVIDSTLVDSFPLNVDVEYQNGFYGFYHGGASLNLAWNGSRSPGHIDYPTCTFGPGDVVGVVVDQAQHCLYLSHNGKVIPFAHLGLPPSVCPLVWMERGWDRAHVHYPRCLLLGSFPACVKRTAEQTLPSPGSLGLLTQHKPIPEPLVTCTGVRFSTLPPELELGRAAIPEVDDGDEIDFGGLDDVVAYWAGNYAEAVEADPGEAFFDHGDFEEGLGIDPRLDPDEMAEFMDFEDVDAEDDLSGLVGLGGAEEFEMALPSPVEL